MKVQDAYKDYYLIEEGIKRGDKVVFEGLQQVKTGVKINPVDTVFQSQF